MPTPKVLFFDGKNNTKLVIIIYHLTRAKPFEDFKLHKLDFNGENKSIFQSFLNKFRIKTSYNKKNIYKCYSLIYIRFLELKSNNVKDVMNKYIYVKHNKTIFPWLNIQAKLDDNILNITLYKFFQKNLELNLSLGELFDRKEDNLTCFLKESTPLINSKKFHKMLKKGFIYNKKIPFWTKSWKKLDLKGISEKYLKIYKLRENYNLIILNTPNGMIFNINQYKKIYIYFDDDCNFIKHETYNFMEIASKYENELEFVEMGTVYPLNSEYLIRYRFYAFIMNDINPYLVQLITKKISHKSPRSNIHLELPKIRTMFINVKSGKRSPVYYLNDSYFLFPEMNVKSDGKIINIMNKSLDEHVLGSYVPCAFVLHDVAEQKKIFLKALNNKNSDIYKYFSSHKLYDKHLNKEILDYLGSYDYQ